VGADLGRLAQLFQDHPEIAAMHSYQLLARVLKERPGGVQLRTLSYLRHKRRLSGKDGEKGSLSAL
jgi:hypothetical protein